MGVGAAGQDAGEVDGVRSGGFAATAGFEVATGRPGQPQAERLAVPAGPLGQDVGDDAGVVAGGQFERAPGGAAMSTRCIHASRVNPMSNR